jgi:hypothetical protein
MPAAPAHMLRIEPLRLFRQFLDYWRPFLAVHAAAALLSASVLLPAAAALLRMADVFDRPSLYREQ